MRSAICLLLLLGGLMQFAAGIDVAIPSAAPTRVAESPWRRTKDGWQRADRWPGAARSTEPMEWLGLFAVGGPASFPHPLIVALLLLLTSLLFLLAFSNEAHAK
jgi:hypothetical protein